MTNNGTKHYFGKMNVQRRTELCYINKEKVGELLGLKENDYLLTILPLGYPLGDIPKARPRKSLNEIVNYFD